MKQALIVSLFAAAMAHAEFPSGSFSSLETTPSNLCPAEITVLVSPTQTTVVASYLSYDEEFETFSLNPRTYLGTQSGGDRLYKIKTSTENKLVLRTEENNGRALVYGHEFILTKNGSHLNFVELEETWEDGRVQKANCNLRAK